jgi:hypothetical protein
MKTFAVPYLGKEKGAFGMMGKSKLKEILKGSDTKHEYDVKVGKFQKMSLHTMKITLNKEK